jgi:DNA-directed RNA polymerase specialized sigma subunit
MKKAKSQKNYFTQDHEEAILKYVASTSKEERTELYKIYIGPAFQEMVNKIVYSFKFTNLPNIEYLMDECKIWLITILDKYDTQKNSKAFSYFSVIVKNWFIQKTKKKAKAIQYEVPLDEVTNENDFERKEEDDIDPEDTIISNQFVLYLRAEMVDWEQIAERTNDERVVRAIQILMDSAQEIEIFNKKAIYLYLREITGLNTKQVVASLKRLKPHYDLFKKSWDDGEI